MASHIGTLCALSCFTHTVGTRRAMTVAMANRPGRITVNFAGRNHNFDLDTVSHFLLAQLQKHTGKSRQALLREILRRPPARGQTRKAQVKEGIRAMWNQVADEPIRRALRKVDESLCLLAQDGLGARALLRAGDDIGGHLRPAQKVPVTWLAQTLVEVRNILGNMTVLLSHHFEDDWWESLLRQPPPDSDELSPIEVPI